MNTEMSRFDVDSLHTDLAKIDLLHLSPLTENGDVPRWKETESWNVGSLVKRPVSQNHKSRMKRHGLLTSVTCDRGVGISAYHNYKSCLSSLFSVLEITMKESQCF